MGGLVPPTGFKAGKGLGVVEREGSLISLVLEPHPLEGSGSHAMPKRAILRWMP